MASAATRVSAARWRAVRRRRFGRRWNWERCALRQNCAAANSCLAMKPPEYPRCWTMGGLIRTAPPSRLEADGL